MRGYRVVIADSDDNGRKYTGSILSKAGFIVVGEAVNGSSALKVIRGRQPDIAIIEATLPGMEGTEIARIVGEDRIAPVIITSGRYQQAFLEKAKATRAFAYLVKPLADTVLIPAVELAMANFQELVKYEKQIKDLRETIESRKIVEKAKGIIMNSLGIPEEEAFKRIQKQSMNKRLSMRAVAEAIIMAYNIHNPK